MVDRRRGSSTAGTLQRAAVACQSCRLRKVKCDAQSAPSEEGCTPCRRSGQVCLLDPLSDGRRSVSVKFVDKLQQRIETLEALNQRTGSQLDWRPMEEEAMPPTTATVHSSNQTTIQHVSASAERTELSESLSSRISYGSHQSLPAPVVAGDSPGNVGGGGGGGGDSPSFYGATSHPHVASPTEEARLTSSDDMDVVSIDLDADSPRLRDRILRSFFKYQTLWVDIVDRESFFLHQTYGVESRWFSRFLENSMLACGARLSTSRSVRTLASTYCERAKDATLRAMSEPTPANLQGFLLLSEYEVTQGNDRPGWMFCGVACRMLSDLGLHELSSPPKPFGDAQAIKESKLSYSLLSACIIYEGVWTLYLGRPSSIPASVMNTAASRCKKKHKSDSPWLNAWLGLCVPMAQVTQVLNNQSISHSDKSDVLHGLLKQVEEWYENLPLEFTYNENGLTNMDLTGYGLHSQYCKLQILLRQALAELPKTRKRRHSQSSSDESIRAPSNDSNLITYQYALRIARLMTTYREAFGTEKIHSIMLDNAVVAATTMIRYLNKADNAYEKRHQAVWLRQLIKSMELLQPHFPIVRRMLESLKQICGSRLLCNMLLSSHRNSTDAHIQEPLQLIQTQDFDFGSYNTLESSSALGREAEITWDFFNTDFTSCVLLPGGFGDSALNASSVDTVMSSFAQPVP
ncbi:hypothetical protein BKA66DRAFT_528241 [Pyrenochaeta sp. MPI-SDFR-AT-0127]|nr:hypothetical protein BKA66DRAFT_528241 [Pyrenochaeta sp. MPI-SDFR-AT-0127]